MLKKLHRAKKIWHKVKGKEKENEKVENYK